jgi:gephyrin
MAHVNLKPAILVVSDTASLNPSSDKTGPALLDSFSSESSASWAAPVAKIVADNVLEIQRTVCQWTDGEGAFNLILTAGGTGFAVRDNTPEVRCRDSVVHPRSHHHLYPFDPLFLVFMSSINI